MLKHLLKKIRPIEICLAVFSLTIVSSCAGVPRPVGSICVSHMPESYNNCYDLEKDFDENGEILATAQSTHIPLDLDSRVNLDDQSFGNLKAYFLKIKDRYKNCQPQP